MIPVRMMGRLVSSMRVSSRPWSKRIQPVPMSRPTHVRHFYRGPFSREPFTQMEEFMKDVERKFKRDIEDTMGLFARRFPGKELPGSGVVARTAQPSFGEIENLSTPEKYQLNFYFPNAKPEDIKVTLKGVCGLFGTGGLALPLPPCIHRHITALLALQMKEWKRPCPLSRCMCG